jgi:hypothetical protein
VLVVVRANIRPGYSAAMEKYNKSNALFVSNRYLAFFLFILIIIYRGKGTGNHAVLF